MSQFSILDLSAPPNASNLRDVSPRLSFIQLKAPDPQDCLSFLNEDLDMSPDGVAERELDAALQLLAERAKFITGASGATIGLLDGDKVVWRASIGLPRFDVATDFELSSGLLQECLRTKQSVVCADSQKDTRFHGKSCRELNVVSAMSVPIIRQEAVAGVFELFSERSNAFGQGDVEAVKRLGELVNAATDDAQAMKVASRGDKDKVSPPAPVALELNESSEARVGVERKGIHTCFSCRFPISSGRSLCLDCETGGKGVTSDGASAMFAALDGHSEQGWLREHIYTVGMIMVPLATIAVLLWLR
ncbi:MAG: diguanylate cyclase [Acidobacteriaceae bacterium]|jgi:putative methionine-R-sulfoxide reductase with GAF domain